MGKIRKICMESIQQQVDDVRVNLVPELEDTILNDREILKLVTALNDVSCVCADIMNGFYRDDE